MHLISIYILITIYFAVLVRAFYYMNHIFSSCGETCLNQSCDMIYAGINPDGNHYSVANISQAIKQAVGFAPGIKCNTDPAGNRQLNEIYLCADKSASNFIECPILPSQNSCTDTVEFPIF